MKMKTLTIKNPWGWLVASGLKEIENRTWHTPFRGRVLIHTSATLWNTKDGLTNPISCLNSRQVLQLFDSGREREFERESFRTSTVIGSVEITDCIQGSDSIWAEQDQWHWVLSNPVLFKVPLLFVKGKLGIWELDVNEEWLRENDL